MGLNSVSFLKYTNSFTLKDSVSVSCTQICRKFSNKLCDWLIYLQEFSLVKVEHIHPSRLFFTVFRFTQEWKSRF